MKKLSFIILIFAGNLFFSQNGSVGINTSTPDPSAILDLESFTGTPATATATINAGTGTVTSITVTNGGKGYKTVPTVSIVDGGSVNNGGSKATAVAVLTAGVVTSITVTNGGSKYLSVPTVKITNSDKGLLIPRVDLSVLNSTTTPILNPADGLLAVNNNSTVNPKALYYFDSTKGVWIKNVLAINTPQIAFIELSGNTNALLNPAAPGNDFYALQSLPVVSPASTIEGVKIVPNQINGAGTPFYSIQIPPGNYTVEIKLNLTANPVMPLCTGCSQTALSQGGVTSNYYIMGYYLDFFSDYVNQNNGQVLRIDNNRNRKENNIVSQVGPNHFSTWIYNLTFPNYGPTQPNAISLYIGRNQGSSYYNQAQIIGTGSYIKITKN